MSSDAEPLPTTEDKFRSRKWIMARTVLGIATMLLVLFIALSIFGWGVAALPSIAELLNWWSITAGSVLAMYGGGNVWEKSVFAKNGGSK